MDVNKAIEVLKDASASSSDKDEAEKVIKETLEKQKKESAALQKQVNKEYRESSDLTKKILGNTKDTSNVFEFIYRRQVSVLTDSISWLKNTKEQFLYAEGVAEQYKELGRNIGIGGKQAKALSDSFKASLPYFERMGLNSADLKNTLQSISEESGRFKGFFPEEDTKRMANMIVGLDMSAQSVGELTDRFDLMGVSVEGMYDSLSEVYGDAQALGLNAKKVTDVLQDNFASMQRMSFKGGVKAMTEMSKLAVKMRMDVSQMLGMADKFYNPEQAIEAVAELQLMGGEIANAFGDPFEVMYMARNKPEELAKKLETMTENMAVFNEKTGEYELPPEARQQLDFMADKLSLSTDKVIDMAFQTSKLKDIKDAFDGSDMFSDEEQSAIASMAKFKDGQWTVDFDGKSIPIEDTGAIQNAINDGMLQSQPDDDPIKRTADSTFTIEQINTQMLNEMKANTINQVDFYRNMEAAVVEPQKKMTTILNKLVTNSVDLLKDPNKVGEKIAEFVSNPEVKAKELGDQIVAKLDVLEKGIDGMFSGDINVIDSLKNKIGDLTKSLVDLKGKITIVKAQDGIMEPGGGLVQMGKGSMSAVIQPDVNDYAFFIQKDKVTKGGENKTTTNNNNTTTTLAGTATINVNIKSDNPSLNLSGMEDKIVNVITKVFNNGGDPNSIYLATKPNAASQQTT